jgi:hypothetical protein
VLSRSVTHQNNVGGALLGQTLCYRERDREAVRDSLTHVSIMPRVTMLLAQYELAIANTQKYWQRVKI